MAGGLVGVIGGSGLGDALLEHISDAEVKMIDTPFGEPSSGVLIGKIGDKKIAFLNRHGDGHKYGPSEVNYAANIFALKAVGVTAVIASGAVGSLKEVIKPKELVVVDQFIDKTFRRQSSYFGNMGAVHCEMAEPICGRLRDAIITASKSIDTRTHIEGTYVCMEGPQFSTRAESLMHIGWGGDLIGMTAMPEAKLAREAQMCYSLIALASDYDCWREHAEEADKQELLKEIIGNLTAATNNAIELIKATLESGGGLCDDNCGCRKSLELAVWSRPKVMNEGEMEKLKVLFE